MQKISRYETRQKNYRIPRLFTDSNGVNAARGTRDGVQASADFLWLKPIDRRLWYMLNTVGRQTPFAEVAGPYAHWLAEREMGKRILMLWLKKQLML